MRYHLIIDGYSGDRLRQMEEQNAFKHRFLSGLEEGEAYYICGEGEYSPEMVLNELEKEAVSEDIYIFGSGFSGTELSVRLSARMKGSSVTSVHGLDIINGDIIARKMVYSNHMEGAFQMQEGPYCISLAKGMDRDKLDEEVPDKEVSDNVKEIRCQEFCEFVISRNTEEEEMEGGLLDAKLILAVGRGAKKKECVETLEKTAKALGGELGVSRPAAMNAWASMQKLIGVSGGMLKPDICIAAGVSGAAAFYAGIEKSKFIVAVNTDRMAPIMKKADVAVEDDFEPVLQALKELVLQ